MTSDPPATRDPGGALRTQARALVAEGDLDATRELASFIVNTRFDDIPDDVIHAARRATLDCLGVSIAASTDPSSRILLEALDLLGGAAQATAWMSGRRVSLAHATQHNGHLGHVLDFDDTYLSEVTVIHCNAVVVPAAFAVAEWLRASGAEYLRAMVLGYEVMARIAVSAGRRHHTQRWHVTSTVGAFAAAAAAGVLLGLDEMKLRHAFGIAGAQGGVIAVLGSMAKGLQTGRASMNGVIAALLAQRGFTGAADILTGRFGFHEVYHSDRDMEALLGGLGTRWEIRRAGLKPYACGIGLHALLAGVIELRNRHDLMAKDLDTIHITCNPQVLIPTGDPAPTTGLAGKFSVYHAAAVAFVDGAAGPAQFTDRRVNDSTVLEVRAKVRVIPDGEVARDEARIAIELRDGRIVTEHVKHAPGTADNPLSDDRVLEKFRSLAEEPLGATRAQELMATVMHLHELRDLGPLVALMGMSDIEGGTN